MDRLELLNTTARLEVADHDVIGREIPADRMVVCATMIVRQDMRSR